MTVHMTTEQAETYDHNSIIDRITNAVSEQSEIFKEMFPVIEGAWVALVAGQHMLMVAEPGVAKSMFARDIASRVTGANYFATMLTPTSEPTSIIGPRDFEAMRQGHHVYRTDGFLPTAHIAFLDEVLNSNGATLDNMLSLLNERVFHEDGQVKNMPLWTVFMATNQLSEQQRQAGWWDRIHQRHKVGDVQDRDNMAQLIAEDIERTRDGNQDNKSSISLDELVAAHKKSLTLSIPDGTMQTLVDIKERLETDYDMRISPRRMSNTMQAAMAMAYLNGHDYVDVKDLSIAEHMLWITSDQQADVAHAVAEYVSDSGGELNDLASSLENIRLEWDRLRNDQSMESSQLRIQAVEPWENASELLAHADETRERIKKRNGDTSQIDQLYEQINDLTTQIMEEGMQFSAQADN